MLPIRTTSTVYVRARVSAKESGSTVDLSGDTVSVAFADTDTAPDPDSDAWNTAGWDVDTTTTPDTYRAQVLVGPSGTVELDTGIHHMFVMVDHDPEIPILYSGIVEVVA